MIGQALQRLRQDCRGAIAPLVAVLGAALIGAAGVALDTGLYYVDSRDLQAATEAAALSAAVDPANATNRAQAFLTRNGYPASVLQSVQVGRYCADVGTNWTARFHAAGATQTCTGNGINNAVRLTTGGQSQRYLTGVLGSANPIPALAATATAARIDEAGLGMTTGTIALSPISLVNTLLSALAGVNISLTQQQLQTLLASNIDAGLMFDALAARVGETGTYSQLLQRTVSLTDLMAACQTALGQTGGSAATAAIQTLAGQMGRNLQVPLAGLFDLGVWKNMPVGDAADKPALRAGLNSYQLIAYALQTQNRQAAKNGLPITIANVAGVDLAGTAAGPVERARFAFGPAGEVTASTAVMRILLKVKLANLNGLLDGLGLSILQQTLLAPVFSVLGSTTADIPLLIQIDGGQAAITSINCGQEAATDARVDVAGSTGLLNAYLGQMPGDVLTQPLRPIGPTDIQPVNLLNLLGLVTVSVRANIGPVLGQSRTASFLQTAGGDGVIGHVPGTGTAARIGNGSQLGPLMTGLVSNLQVNACVLGVCTGSLVSGVVSNVGKLLGATVGALGVDPLLDNLLNLLGVQAGYADTWVTGVRCGGCRCWCESFRPRDPAHPRSM